MIGESSNTRHYFMLVCFIICCATLPLARPYPMIISLEPGKEICMGFNIPAEDNARLAVVPLSNRDLPTTLDYYSNTMSLLPWEANVLPDPSPETKRTFQQSDLRCGVFARLKRTPRPILRHQPLRYHNGVIFKDIVHMGMARYSDNDEEDKSYDICFNPATATEKVVMIFDFELKSAHEDRQAEQEKKDRKLKERKVVKKHQFSPLETALHTSVNKANRIVSELRYMEKREMRMRQTAESTNSRVRYFSYLSIGVMVATTFFQGVYLKNYFKKKKAL